MQGSELRRQAKGQSEKIVKARRKFVSLFSQQRGAAAAFGRALLLSAPFPEIWLRFSVISHDVEIIQRGLKMANHVEKEILSCKLRTVFPE